MNSPRNGVPVPTGPPGQMTEEMKGKILVLLVAYLLYERHEDTELTFAFAQVVSERHRHFHLSNGEDPELAVNNWIRCENDVCIKAREVIKNARRQEIQLNPLSKELMERYAVNFQVTETMLRAWLVDKPNATPIVVAPATARGPVPVERKIVLQ